MSKKCFLFIFCFRSFIDNRSPKKAVWRHLEAGRMLSSFWGAVVFVAERVGCPLHNRTTANLSAGSSSRKQFRVEDVMFSFLL